MPEKFATKTPALSITDLNYKKILHCATAKMAIANGHRQDSFVTGVCGPDLSRALQAPSGSALGLNEIYMYVWFLFPYLPYF